MAGGINCSVILGLSFRVSEGLVRKKREKRRESCNWRSNRLETSSGLCVCIYV